MRRIKKNNNIIMILVVILILFFAGYYLYNNTQVFSVTETPVSMVASQNNQDDLVIRTLGIFLPFALTTCTPDSGYDKCILYDGYYGFTYNQGKLNVFYGSGNVYVGGRQIKAKSELLNGEKSVTYLLDGRGISSWSEFWSNVQCSSNGIEINCNSPLMVSGNTPSIITTLEGRTSDNVITDCPIFLSVTSTVNSDGSWSYESAANGYLDSDDNGICFLGIETDCKEDSDCGSGNICTLDKYTNFNGVSYRINKCETKVCDSGDTVCEGLDLFSCDTNLNDYVLEGKIVGYCGVDCKTSSDCADPILTKTCENGDVYQIEDREVCLNFKCEPSQQKTLFDDCMQESQEVICKTGDVYRRTSGETCSNAMCEPYSDDVLIESCDFGCFEGNCIDEFESYIMFIENQGFDPEEAGDYIKRLELSTENTQTLISELETRNIYTSEEIDVITRITMGFNTTQILLWSALGFIIILFVFILIRRRR